MTLSKNSTPAYKIIKQAIIQKINLGEFKRGKAITPETKLAEQYHVSRMTVNRAIKELVQEQVLTRIQGSGTYVTQQKYQTTPVAIKNIADEIRERGDTYASRLFDLSEIKATDLLKDSFNMPKQETFFYSEILHYENDLPIQLECRWVNPLLASDYLEKDFQKITPNEYLMNAVPLEGGEYIIEAVQAPKVIMDKLESPSTNCFLVLTRKTFSNGQVASIAKLWHPGNHYRFIGEF